MLSSARAKAMRPQLACQQAVKHLYAHTAKFPPPPHSNSEHIQRVNRPIIEVLEQVKGIHESLGDEFRVSAYTRAIGVLRRWRTALSTVEDARALANVRGLGRIAAKVAEIIRTGKLRELQMLNAREDVRAVRALCGVHGVGRITALRWFRQGIRNIDDLRAQSDYSPDTSQPMIRLTEPQRLGIRHYRDSQHRIPRDEATQIYAHVRKAVRLYLPQGTVMCCGSYRRGSASCGDVDLLVTDDSFVETSSDFLVQVYHRVLSHLRQCSCAVKHSHKHTCAHPKPFIVGDLSSGEGASPHGHCSFMGYAQLTGCRVRRVDLKFYPRAHFAFALLYFSGDAHFNRSLRFYAKQLGYSLSDHGLSVTIRDKSGDRVYDCPSVECDTEREIFEKLGLFYVPPHLRDMKRLNAPLNPQSEVELKVGGESAMRGESHMKCEIGQESRKPAQESKKRAKIRWFDFIDERVHSAPYKMAELEIDSDVCSKRLQRPQLVNKECKSVRNERHTESSKLACVCDNADGSMEALCTDDLDMVFLEAMCCEHEHSQSDQPATSPGRSPIIGEDPVKMDDIACATDKGMYGDVARDRGVNRVVESAAVAPMNVATEHVRVNVTPHYDNPRKCAWYKQRYQSRRHPGRIE